MRISERLVVYAGVAVALGAGLAGWSASKVEARAHAAGFVQPEAPMKIATCDVFKVAKTLMLTDRYKKVIEDRQAELKGQMPSDAELRTLADRLRAMGPDAKGPEAEALAREFSEKRSAYVAKAQELDAELNKFVVAKNMEAYEQVLDSVNAVAERRGFTHVFTSRSSDEMKDVEGTSAFLQFVLSRPLVKAPADTDLTADVLADLKL